MFNFPFILQATRFENSLRCKLWSTKSSDCISHIFSLLCWHSFVVTKWLAQGKCNICTLHTPRFSVRVFGKIASLKTAKTLVAMHCGECDWQWRAAALAFRKTSMFPSQRLYCCYIRKCRRLNCCIFAPLLRFLQYALLRVWCEIRSMFRFCIHRSLTQFSWCCASSPFPYIVFRSAKVSKFSLNFRRIPENDN